MNWLDWVLILVVLTYALSGYWQGFVTGAFATIGLLLGGGVGIFVVPWVFGSAEPSVGVSMGAIFIVILCASLGQALLQFAGARVRDRITWQPVRAVDAVGGAALSAVAVLIVVWALGVAVSGTRLGGLSESVRESRVLRTVDNVLPANAHTMLGAFENVVGTTFPRYLEPFAPEQIVDVAPGPQRLLNDPDVLRAEQSVLKVEGDNSCGRGIEGTGFLYADDRLMTNAHVVAGVDSPTVEIDGDEVDATVVLYDDELDVAVLALDDRDRAWLPFDRKAKDNDGVAILGYPNDGPYDVQAARIRSEQRLRSPDIYGSGTVLRDVFALRGLVRPGNSGGPIVTSSGDVAGVVFAASVTDNDTGYALTATQVAESAAEGIASSTRVSTGDCAG